MASTIRIDLNKDNVREVALTSPEVRAMIEAKAEAVASAARSNDTGNLPVSVYVGGNRRARAYIHYPSAVRESRDRVLGRAIDAAR